MDWLSATIGGIMIGLGSLIALAASGKIPGISGVVARLLRPQANDSAWRAVFLVGLIVGAGVALGAGLGWQDYELPVGRSLPVMALAGLLVGFGTRMGGGCTSGHGVCGIGSAARDGLIYTLVFMGAGIATVFIWNFVMGGLAS